MFEAFVAVGTAEAVMHELELLWSVADHLCPTPPNITGPLRQNTPTFVYTAGTLTNGC
jgi:hypothetical protein